MKGTEREQQKGFPWGETPGEKDQKLISPFRLLPLVEVWPPTGLGCLGRGGEGAGPRDGVRPDGVNGGLSKQNEN